jgi:TolA-binding protein
MAILQQLLHQTLDPCQQVRHFPFRTFEGPIFMRTALIIAILSTSLIMTPVVAQSDTVPLRVSKLEKEMKAVQRKVFPTGAPVESEIGAPQQLGPVGSPSNTPISDLTARVDALEAQLKSMTGAVEQQGFRLKKLEDAMKASEARIKALEPQPEPTETSSVVGPMDVATPVTDRPTVTQVSIAPKPAAAAKPATALAKPSAPAPKPATPAKADPKRKAMVEAVEIPVTNDPTEDAYTYGFRLWSAKLYPEAQVKLKEFVAKNPKHKRASYAQNLLGRAYLDEGKPALASVAFYDNYQKMPRGERASESLYWLGISLTRLNKPADACKVYQEFNDVYGASAVADLKARVAKGRTDAKCAA